MQQGDEAGYVGEATGEDVEHIETVEGGVEELTLLHVAVLAYIVKDAFISLPP